MKIDEVPESLFKMLKLRVMMKRTFSEEICSEGGFRVSERETLKAFWIVLSNKLEG